MADNNAISDIQAVDFAMGGVIVGAYDGLKDDSPIAFRRFLARPAKQKIFRAENEDPQSLLRRIAKKGGENKTPDLPIVAYYRAPSIMGNPNEKPVALAIDRYLDDMERGFHLSTIPVTLTYSLLWCAWDKPTLDKMTLAWYCYIAQPARRFARFLVPYRIDDEPMDIPASISTPREIQADSADVDQTQGRLWAARTTVEVNTQVLYGRQVKIIDEITAISKVRLIKNTETQYVAG